MNRLVLALLALAAMALAEGDSLDANAIHCVQCSTQIQTDCDEVPDNYASKCLTLKSGALNGTSAVACRKIIQKVGDETTVIRECAYTAGDVDGQRKTGNSGIVLYYYQCTPESSDKPCNGVSGISFLTASFVAVVARFFM
ncbi:hypothetical protein PRIPAC_97236 [Pristionchus pacificus]|uniref:Uncharacterized protein n=1 Tax=Pristionchus pacificus TaxID=54126 RepID=A0A454XLB5_PRIPA|nr:hypothetical protein PRIPAC_97236 [Pristionchus pacificus]|eukprot:PDM63464.1 hypothetical protein PRIPAC_53821 [Pristionchus pacificus]